MLAGGHSLIPLLKLRFARPSLLVDIGRLDDLRYVREDGDRIAIGALSRHADLALDPVAGRGLRAARPAPPGTSATRRSGTAGRSAARSPTPIPPPTGHDPARTRRGFRRPRAGRRADDPAADFFTGPFETALGPQELLTEIGVPKVEGGRYLKHVGASRTGRRWPSPLRA